MPKITDIEFDGRVRMDNGEVVRVSLHGQGLASSWGASKEALAETVELREALAQVLYDHYARIEDALQIEPESEDHPEDNGDDDVQHVTFARWPFPVPGKDYVLDGEGWAEHDLRGSRVTCAGIVHEDDEAMPFFTYGDDGSLRGFLDPFADKVFSYRSAEPVNLDAGK